MQPLKEVAHIPCVVAKRLWSGKQLSKTCTCSTFASQNQNYYRDNPSNTWNKTPLSSPQKECKKPLKDVTFPTQIRCLHHSSTLFSAKQTLTPTKLTEWEYEAKVEETLLSLSDFFEELQEIAPCSDDYDSGLGNGVLTVHFSGTDGTYVINKQTPNKQIWLSSPITGPKRYDYCDGKWIYLRDGTGLHALLEEEVSDILGVNVSLKQCKYYS